MENQTEKNKRLVLSFIKAVETDDFGSEFDKIVSENYNDHLEGQQSGRDNLKKYLTGIKAAFPDLKWPVKTIIGEGDQVMVFNSVEATHKGDFGPFKATGNKVNVMAFQLYRIENDQLAEHWELADFVKLSQQMQR